MRSLHACSLCPASFRVLSLADASGVVCLQAEAQLASKHITELRQDYQEFKDLISPKFAPLEHDVSVINGVLQLDAQNFNEKVRSLARE